MATGEDTDMTLSPASETDRALQEAIDRGYAERDRDDMAPTICYFEELLAAHPGNARLTYELAGAYDTAGREAEARIRYEEALQLGLSGDALRMCLCQYASTLRWLGELDASLETIRRARREFPDSDAVRVFEALTLNELGRTDEAVGTLLAVIALHGDATDLGRYAVGLGGLADWLIAGRPDD
jgi:tetratricopeptide (TPR) repeat protein